ncbi:sugar ABC transporter substrate-binding protein, partial [Rhizobium ruizarguesonis]
SNKYFNDDGTSTMNSPGWANGIEWMFDLYKKGYAPKDSVNWGFNEVVAGFYSCTCAFLYQDPDALIAIADRREGLAVRALRQRHDAEIVLVHA